MHFSSIKKSITLVFVLTVFFTSALAAGSGPLKRGIYSFDYERVSVSLDVLQMYKEYGMNVSQDVTKLATGAAVYVQNSTFVDPETGLVITVLSNGKIVSPDNPTVSGKYLKNGTIILQANYLENGQTIQLSLTGHLEYSSDLERAGKEFNGTYHAIDPGTNRSQTIWISDGLYYWKYDDTAEDDFSGWPMIVDQDGNFNYVSEYSTSSNMAGMGETFVTSRTQTVGKFEPDGNLNIKILTVNYGSFSQKEETPYTYSAIKASQEIDLSAKENLYTAMQEKGNKSRRSKKLINFAAPMPEGKVPDWYFEEVLDSDEYYEACGKNHDSANAVLSSVIAVNRILSYKGISVQTTTNASNDLSDENHKKLYKTLDSQAFEKTDYEIIENYHDNSGWVYTKVRVRKLR